MMEARTSDRKGGLAQSAKPLIVFVLGLALLALGIASAVTGAAGTDRAGSPAPPKAAGALSDFASLGAGGNGGTFTAVFHNTNPDIIICGQDVGGIYKTTNGGQSWYHVNQNGISLPNFTADVYLTSEIVADPVDDNVFFACTGSGVFRSEDVGESWTLVLPDDPTDLYFPTSWLAFSPLDPALVLVATGDWHEPGDGTDGLGLYRSTDGGLTFAEADTAGIPEDTNISCVVFDPADGSAYVSTHVGLFRTTGGGTTIGDVFTRVDGPFEDSPGQWIGIGGSAGNRRFWYVLYTLGEDGDAASWTGGIYTSTDSATWEQVPNQPQVFREEDAELLRPHGARIHPNDPAILYVDLNTNEFEGGLWRYTHTTGEWVDLLETFTAELNVTNELTWMEREAPPDVEGLRIWPADPNRIISCNEMAVLLSEDGGQNWEQLSLTNLGGGLWTGTGAEVTMAYDMAISQGVLYSAIEDTGVWRSDNRGASWRHLLWLPDRELDVDLDAGVEIYAHPDDANRVYLGLGTWSLGLREVNNSRFYKSTDGGTTFTNITPAMVGPVAGRPALAVHWGDTPGQDTLYGAFHGDTIYKSTDGGTTWIDVSGLIPPVDRDLFFTIVFDPDDANTVYAGLLNAREFETTSEGGLYRTTDGGASWSKLNGFPYQDVPKAMFAGVPQRLFVGGYTVDDDWIATGALLVSDDGTTFTPVLNQPFVHDVIDVPSAPGTLIAIASSSYNEGNGQDAGLYKSTDNGDTWTKIPGSLPHTYVWDLAMFPDDPTRIYMATQGDGIIRATLPGSDEGEGEGEGAGETEDEGEGEGEGAGETEDEGEGEGAGETEGEGEGEGGSPADCTAVAGAPLGKLFTGVPSDLFTLGLVVLLLLHAGSRSGRMRAVYRK